MVLLPDRTGIPYHCPYSEAIPTGAPDRPPRSWFDCASGTLHPVMFLFLKWKEWI
jgi:hypothetical protein